jgi:hypothetical protein
MVYTPITAGLEIHSCSQEAEIQYNTSDLIINIDIFLAILKGYH